MATFADQYRKGTPTVTPSGGASFGSKYRRSTPPATSRTEVVEAPTPSKFTLNPMSPAPNPLITSFQAPQVAQPSSQEVTPLKELGSTGAALDELFHNPLALKDSFLTHPIKAAKEVWNSIKDPVLVERDAIRQVFDTTSDDLAGGYGADLNLIAKTGSLLFSPITALFTAANKVPILGTISRAITLPFSALGDAGTITANEIINQLPISNEAKQKLAPGLGEVFALAAQVAFGGKVDVIGKIGELKKKGFSALDAETIVKKGEELGRQKKVTEILKEPESVSEGVPVEAPVRPKSAPRGELEARVDEYSGAPIRTVSIEQIRPSFRAKLKQGTIDEVVKDGQINRPIELKAEADGTYSIVDGFNRIEGAKQLGLKDLPAILQSERPSLAEFAASGEIKTRGLAQNIETKAIESGLTKGFGELPEYREVKMADQARLAQDLITKDAEFARKVAMGEEAAPKGIIPEAVLVAVENRAIKAGDVATLRDLATKSSLTVEATGMGQRIRTLGERNPDSPVGAIAEIKQIRESKVKDPVKARKSSVKEIKEEIKKKTPTKKDWNSFVESITC